MPNYKTNITWQVSYELAKSVFRLTSSFPKAEMYGIAQQMRRAAVSIPSNIAEGAYRGSRKDYLRFCRIANGSAAELDTQLNISKDLRLTNAEYFSESLQLLDRVLRLLNRLTFSLQDKPE
jgi:four helix bundle protein